MNANQRKEQLRNEAPQLSRITTPRYTVLISAEVRNMIAADYENPIWRAGQQSSGREPDKNVVVV